jgi:hypothetical protein
MLDRHNEFVSFLEKGGRSNSAIERCVRHVSQFQDFLDDHRGGKSVAQAEIDELDAFLEFIESVPKASAKTYLWALAYYFDFCGNQRLKDHAKAQRQMRIQRKAFQLKDFRGVNQAYVELLAKAGIGDVAQMLEAGKDAKSRESLAKETGVPEEMIFELVKLSDLARISGLKGIRARLYYDAGYDTLEKLAECQPEPLREALIEFVERTGFEGIPALPKEVEATIRQAKTLPKLIDHD